MSEEPAEYQSSPPLIPIEQHTITFYGKPLVVIRLPDGQPAIVLSFFCSNLKLDVTGQINRVRRKKALAQGLHYARVETRGGPQTMAVLTLKVVPGWLFDIEASRARPEMREEIERYQAECIDVLYAWAQSRPALPAPAQAIVPAETTITKPEKPEDNAPLAAWRDYYQQMAVFLNWQMGIEEWRGVVDSQIEGVHARIDEVETRLEGVEALAGLVPEVLEYMAKSPLTNEHRATVKKTVEQICTLSGAPYQAVYFELNQAFRVAEYKDILDARWPDVSRWLKRKLEQARGTDKHHQ